MKFDVVVAGGGIQGLSTCWWLVQRGVKRIALLEQFRLGHGRGSSHGRSRITRSSYSSAKYVEMMQWVHAQGWPAWEDQFGQQLLHARTGLFFGPEVHGYRDSLLAHSDKLGNRFEELTPAEARRRYASFLFPDSPLVMVDHTCAVVAAQRTCDALVRAIRAAGVDIREYCPLQDWSADHSAIRLHTGLGPIDCDRLILTTGPWSRSWNGLQQPLRVAHQDVGYFQLEPAADADFPVWVYAGPESFYGLPEFERPGVKLAHHRTGNLDDSPDRELPGRMSDGAAEFLQAFADAQWSGKARLVGYEACLYTNTVSQDFILDHWPGESRVVVGAGFSGHGFKFAPLIGRVLSDLALDGSCGVAEFAAHQDAFRLQAAQAWV